MKRSLVVCLFISLGLCTPLLAILGVGDVVFDPTNYQEAIQQLLQMEQQYMQLVQTYGVIRNQYDEMLRMAQRVPVNMAARYRAVLTPWKRSTASNTYGTTAGWINGINTGVAVQAGYAAATQPLNQYGSALSRLSPEQASRIKTSYATVELTDGANLAGMEIVGRLRGNAPTVEYAIQGLEDDSLSPDPAMNTEIAVLNKINAANLISTRTSQDSNKLLVALTEAQIVASKRVRDAEVQAINNHIRFISEGRAVMAAQAEGTSQAMMTWRMP